jgi:hypothetical protein
MNDRDTIISTLTASARRMRANSALRELAWVACLISGTFLVYQILAVVIDVPAVMSAMSVLLILFAVVSVGFFVVRIFRPIALDETATVTDLRAQLRDELKTAYWFTRRGATSPLIDLQIQRAARAARELDPRKLFSIAVPRSAYAAVGLALSAGLLALVAPRVTYVRASQINIVTNAAIVASTDLRKSPAATQTTHSKEPSDPQALEAATATNAAWKKLESTIQSLGQDQELMAIAAAVKSRDAARAAQLLEELGRKRGFAQAQSTERMPGVAASASQDLVARLQDIFGGNNAPQPRQEANANDQLAIALSVAQTLEQDAKTRTNNPANLTADTAGYNPLQAAIALERYGPRETRRSENQSGEFGGTTDVEGGAMGRRVTQTNAGAGGKPSPNDTSDNNNIEAESVLGKSTMRLAAKLERMKIESNRPDGDDSQGPSDGQYAATRAQQSQLNYQNASQQARYVRENAMSGERVPLAYRGAVKDYFLNLNRKEP